MKMYMGNTYENGIQKKFFKRILDLLQFDIFYIFNPILHNSPFSLCFSILNFKIILFQGRSWNEI